MSASVQLRMEKAVYGGECLGREAGGGKAVFVPLTLPGETVEALVTEQRRTLAKAEVETIIAPAASRVVPRCKHFGSCGGCQYQHADYATQLAMKQTILREILNRAGLAAPQQIDLLAADPWAYRNRMRVALSSGDGIAYRGRHSHTLVEIAECPITAPLLVETARRVAAFLAAQPAPACVTEVEVFANADQSQALATLFCEGDQHPDEAWLDSLHTTLPTETKGLRVEQVGVALRTQILSTIGAASLTYQAAGFGYRVDHGAFFQVNRWLLDAFVALVMGDTEGTRAWDLYAGVGLFARQLTAHCGEVIAVESAPASLEALKANLSGTAAHAIASTTLDYLRRNREEREPCPDLIILDPPRAGLGDQVTTLLNAIGAPQMVYVSCDPTTLARDLRALTQERYRIASVTLVDMFPQTFHLEVVVRLKRC